MKLESIDNTGLFKLRNWLLIIKEKQLRIDKYLKVSRIIKRRTVAAEACDGGRVSINGKTAKPSSEVKAGDLIELRLGAKTIKVQVTDTAEHTLKGDAALLYKIIE